MAAPIFRDFMAAALADKPAIPFRIPPGIRLVRTGGGRGMGTGCNRGLEAARGEFAFLLNNDVEVGEGWLEPMLELDREQERGAIQLYGHIIDVAGQQGDEATKGLFERILGDEEKHHHTFTDLLEG